MKYLEKILVLISLVIILSSCSPTVQISFHIGDDDKDATVEQSSEKNPDTEVLENPNVIVQSPNTDQAVEQNVETGTDQAVEEDEG